MDDKIVGFIEEQTVATICCLDDKGLPYCFTCFYAFDSDEGLLYFKSSPTAKHSTFITETPDISGTVLPDKLNKLFAKGIQLKGKLLDPKHQFCKNASAAYHKRHPLATAMKGEIYTIQLTSLKLTDNSLGFGRKIIWERNAADGLFVAYK